MNQSYCSAQPYRSAQPYHTSQQQQAARLENCMKLAEMALELATITRNLPSMDDKDSSSERTKPSKN
jgi:hypothetical protein